MTLADLKEGQIGTIKHLEPDISSVRLLTLGFFTGNYVYVIHKSLGNSLIQVGNSRIAVASCLLKKIEIKDIKDIKWIKKKRK